MDAQKVRCYTAPAKANKTRSDKSPPPKARSNPENNQEERPDDNEETSPILKKSKPGIGRILFRGLIYSLLFFFLLIVSVGIVLEYFFPAEEVRAIAEAKLR